MTSDAEGGNAAVLRRLALTWLVGSVTLAVAVTTFRVVIFGGLPGILAGLAWVVAVSSWALARVHRVTSGRRHGSSAGWGIGVCLTSLTLVGLMAATWLHAGRSFDSFGLAPLVWVAASGLPFLLCAAAASRVTAIPARILVVGLLVFAVASLVPAHALPWNGRGCIAQSEEEALTYCQ